MWLLAALAWSAWADDDGLSWYVLPTAAYDTDEGLGVGVRAELAWIEVGYAPYRTALVLDAYVATSGYQQHRVRVDQLGLGPQGRGRLTLHFAWRQWLNDGYWGIGNGTARERAFVGPFAAGDDRRRRYAYQLYQPFAHGTWRQRLQDGPGYVAFATASPRFSWVRSYDGSLLEEEQPYGMAGGPALNLSVGVQHDTRWPELVPREGHLIEVGIRASPRLAAEAGGFAGPSVSARGFVSAGPRVVLAGRVMGEWLLGNVPFYEMVHWGGATPVAGVGGYETVRGLSFGRLRAPGKAVVNLEARIRAIDLPVGTRTLGMEVAPYVDAAAVWGAQDPRPTALPVHPAVGAGGRLVLDETFVGRVDMGVGWDAIEEPDGTITRAPTFGLYAVYDYAF